jgi:pyrimidine deaminase RibD-like protein
MAVIEKKKYQEKTQPNWQVADKLLHKKICIKDSLHLTKGKSHIEKPYF